ncbi:NAD-dependent deacetylase [Klebsiella pneumoniae]|uniref:protein acetyllysine N-acetyltransferase n=1 Tax=Klebsiella pneumoniae TaxID=573 RepID=A0A2X1QCV6_KLEPN|nr:NAD-dependent deacetylase [Klebsiella pneumoniae]
MHGELLKVRCSWSGQVLEWTGDVTAEDKCHCCQFPAALRPHVVWFGEMPLGMDEIYSALADADIFIAIGTSGHVYPAAGFVHEARLHGAHTVELKPGAQPGGQRVCREALRTGKRSGACLYR